MEGAPPFSMENGAVISSSTRFSLTPFIMLCLFLLNPIVFGRLFRSGENLRESSTHKVHNPSSALLEGKVKIREPTGAVYLVHHSYNLRDGAVWRVRDQAEAEYDLKVFMVPASLEDEDEIQVRREGFQKDQSMLMNLTKFQCPDLEGGAVEGRQLSCNDNHVQLGLRSNVPVIDKKSGDVISEQLTLQLPASKGGFKKRRVSFSENILMEPMLGGPLSEFVSHKGFNNKAQLALRYPLFVSVAPQLVDGIRFLHQHSVVHLSLDASAVMCADAKCSRVAITDLSTAWDGQGDAPDYAHESMQPAVRFALFYGRGAFDQHWPPKRMVTPMDVQRDEMLRSVPSNISEEELSRNASLVSALKEEDEVMFNPLLNMEPVNLDQAKSVDWYGLGGTLFFLLSGQRPMVDDFSGAKAGATSFVMTNLAKMTKGHTKSKFFKRVQEQATEALLLVDGLLQENRADRISFDVGQKDGLPADFSIIPKKLRGRGQSLLANGGSSPPTPTLSEDDVIGTSCFHFVSLTAKDEFKVEVGGLEGVMKGICNAK